MARFASAASVVALAVVAMGALAVSVVDDPADDVAAGPPRTGTACVPPAAGDEDVPDEDVAVRLVEQFLAARAAGTGAQGCLGDDARALYERAERFEGPHGERAAACLYFDACPDGDRIEDAAVLDDAATIVYGVGRIVEVRLRYQNAGVVTETLTVGHTARPGDQEAVVLIVEMGLSPGAIVTAADAEQLVVAFLDALAVGDWELAARLFTHPAADHLGQPGVGWWSDDIERLLAAEPELAARQDIAGLLAAWCEDHGGACLPVAEVTGNNPFRGIGREVSVRLRRQDGATAVFADGSDQATFEIGWFEHITWVADIPPRLHLELAEAR